MAQEKNPDSDNPAPEGFVTDYSNATEHKILSLYAPNQKEPLRMYGLACDFTVSHTTELDSVRADPENTHHLSFEFSFNTEGSWEKAQTVLQIMAHLIEKIKAEHPEAECRPNERARKIQVNFDRVDAPLRFISEFYNKYYKRIAQEYAEGKKPLGEIHEPSPAVDQDIADPPIVRGDKSPVPFQRRIIPPAPKRTGAEDEMWAVVQGVTALTRKFFPEGELPTPAKHNLFRSELRKEPKPSHPEWRSIANLNFANERLELITKTAKAWFPVTPKPLTEEEKAAQVPPRTQASPVTERQHELFELFLYDALVEPPERKR